MGTTTSPMRPDSPPQSPGGHAASKPSLLLHICCGPCAGHVVDSLSPAYRLVGLFFNPNIHPRDEFYRRLEAAWAVCRARGIPLWASLYDPTSWFRAVRGRESDPEGGERCRLCFSLRLEATARIASGASFDFFATTLTTSPHKDAGVVNDRGEHWARVHAVGYLRSDFKKRDGYRRSLEISKELGLYRQRYCGCRFSAGAMNSSRSPSRGQICL